MPSRGFIIGTNLMFLAHVHSFVLLTANFEDVKKLAQKFVSESIAETIAEYVAKASGNKIDMKASKTNIPKSNVQFESDSMSDDKETKESISKENMKYKTKILKRKKHKAKLQSKYTKSSEETDMKRNKKLKMKYLSDNNLNDFSEDSAAPNVSVESTAGYLDAGVTDKNITTDRGDDSASDYVFELHNEPREIKIKIDRSFTLTTRKEKVEFDQYVNTYYPKAVATSGGVALKRILNSRRSRYRSEKIN